MIKFIDNAVTIRLTRGDGTEITTAREVRAAFRKHEFYLSDIKIVFGGDLPGKFMMGEALFEGTVHQSALAALSTLISELGLECAEDTGDWDRDEWKSPPLAYVRVRDEANMYGQPNPLCTA